MKLSGAGKTVIAKALIDGIKETVLFVSPRINLMLQFNLTFDEEIKGSALRYILQEAN